GDGIGAVRRVGIDGVVAARGQAVRGENDDRLPARMRGGPFEGAGDGTRDRRQGGGATIEGPRQQGVLDGRGPLGQGRQLAALIGLDVADALVVAHPERNTGDAARAVKGGIVPEEAERVGAVAAAELLTGLAGISELGAALVAVAEGLVARGTE